MENKILKKLAEIYIDYRDLYDGKKFKVEMNQNFFDDHGYENCWWVNLEVVDNMWDDILGLFSDKDAIAEIDKLREKFHKQWKEKKNKFSQRKE